MEQTLDKIYHDPAHPGGLGGVQKLRDAVRKYTGKVPETSEVKRYLQGQDVYTLHAQAGLHFPRNKVLVSGIDKQFQADLVDMSEYSLENDNVHYLLTCIDVFSKFAWVRCLENKTGAAVAKAFEDILSEGRIPVKLQTDQGTEFYNKHFQQLMGVYNIKHFSTSNETKASIVERFNRTFKTRMWRYLTSVNSRRYVDVVQDLIKAYNESRHRSIKMAPANVNKDNEKIVFNTLYNLKKASRIISFKYNVGDTVRISKLRGVFRKGYEQTFTDEFYTITRRIPRDQPVYRISDCSGEEVKGTFYEPELQQVIINKNKMFKIERIISRKTIARKKMALVKWLGWPEKFNSWIAEKDIVAV